MESEIDALVPSHKSDLRTAEAAIAVGWPSVQPIADRLLEWLKDINWPVAHILAPFFACVGPELAPHVRRILRTDDDVWKYYVIQAIVTPCPGLGEAVEEDLKRIAENPTAAEHQEEVDLVAREALDQL